MSTKFIPKKFKHKKIHKRVRISNLIDYKKSFLKDFDFGLKIMKNVNLSSVVLEATRRSITRRLKRTGLLRINGFPFVSITKKSLGVRMGKGIGSISSWVVPVKRGRILFELKGVSFNMAKNAFRSASYKIPVETKFVYKN